MGMFDSLIVKCPSCDADVEFQSKTGECILANYDIYNVPPAIAGALDGKSETCKCGCVLTINTRTFVDIEIRRE